MRATVGLYGSIGARKILSVVREQTFMTGLFADKRWKPRSFAFVYAHSSGKSRNRIVSMGKRQPNDKLLYFKSKLVRKSNRFAEDEFQVQDNDYSITKVTFTFSVSVIDFFASYLECCVNTASISLVANSNSLHQQYIYR